MPTWPGTLPQSALINDYTESLEDNLSRFQPEVGPPKLRRRSSIFTTSVGFSMLLTSAQLATLETFYKTTLEDGALSFTTNDFRDETPTTEYTFTSPYTFNSVSNDIFVVSFSMRRLP